MKIEMLIINRQGNTPPHTNKQTHYKFNIIIKQLYSRLYNYQFDYITMMIYMPKKYILYNIY